MLPNFVIIGAQKSGSTFFLRCLGQHPDVFMAPGEVRFFEDPEYLHSDIHQLADLFRAATREKALGMKRPDYLPKPECPARIHQHLPDARLIAILRNPVDRAISAYYHQMKFGFIPIRPAEEGLSRILAGEYQRTYRKAAEIIEYGFYHQHLTRYLNYFDKSRMLILRFDAIKANPLAAVQQAYRFVGVDDAYVPAAFGKNGRRNHNPGVYSLARLRLLNVRNPFRYTYNADRTRMNYKPQPSVIDRAVNRLVLTADGLVLSRLYGEAKPEVSPALRRRLFEIYEADINRLEELLVQPLDEWRPAAIQKGAVTHA